MKYVVACLLSLVVLWGIFFTVDVPRQYDQSIVYLTETDVRNESLSPSISPSLSPTLSPSSSPSLSPTPSRCNGNYHLAMQVYNDNECYPPIITVNPGVVRSFQTSAPLQVLELFQTAKYTVQFNPVWEPYRNLNATVKLFENVTCYRRDTVTYIKSSTVWTPISRCYYGNEPAIDCIGYVPIMEIEEAVITPSEIWGDGYFHMIFEKAFPLGSARSLIEGNPGIKIIVEKIYPRLAEFLELIGITWNQIIVVDHNQAVIVHKAYLVYPNICGSQSPEHIRGIRRWIHDLHPSLYSRKATTIIVLTRDEGGRCNRCLVNTADIVRELHHRYPDRIVHSMSLGMLPMQDQMAILSECDVLVAPHGAGLVNMVFLPHSAKIVEVLNHPEYYQQSYLEMAIALDLKYRGISPLKIAPGYVDYNRGDPAQIVRAVDELINLTI